MKDGSVFHVCVQRRELLPHQELLAVLDGNTSVGGIDGLTEEVVDDVVALGWLGGIGNRVYVGVEDAVELNLVDVAASSDVAEELVGVERQLRLSHLWRQDDSTQQGTGSSMPAAS